MTRVVLFNSQSANIDSPTFEIKGQRTFMSTGMQPGDFMTFEIVKVAAGARSFVCGCRISEMGVGVIEGVQELQCSSCEETSQRPVRMTLQNPVVVLDFPQGVIMRAIYTGDGLDLRTVTVWSEESTTQDLTPELRGCPPIFVSEADMVWSDTGNYRCVTGGGIQYEQTNDCGRRRWFLDVARPQVWVDTPNTRCANNSTGVEVEQTNQCGDRRWQLSLTLVQEWVANGVHRCTPIGDVELQETNQCGNRRWVVCGSVEWIDTGKFRCGLVNLENEQTNQCGHRRWFATNTPLTWTATGVTRCGAVNFERQETNNCGIERWVSTGPLSWVATGVTRCEGANLESQETNNCGGTRWTIVGPLLWTLNGQTRCVGLNFERQESNNCGGTRWVAAGLNTWSLTGVTSCVNGTTRNQQVDLCGNLRLVDTGAACGDSSHFVSSVVRAPLSGPEGTVFCWTVTLNTPVVGSPLTLGGALSGSEQSEHNYPFPNMIIPVGQSSGQMCVATNVDLLTTADLSLCLQVQPNARLGGIPAALCVTVTEGVGDPGFSQHTILSVVPVTTPITEGQSACWNVTLNSPVVGANLPVSFSLSGDEQTVNGYLAPSLIIAIGASAGQVCVATTDDAIDEPNRVLGLSAVVGGRVLSVPAVANITVLDNDVADPGNSTHTVLSVVAAPLSAPEGTTFNWTVTVNAPVVGANLPLVSTLTGAEQGIHNYTAPTGVILIGATSGVLSVTTTDDLTREPTRNLALQLLTSPRITAVPAAASVDVLDNDPIPMPQSISGIAAGSGGCFSSLDSVGVTVGFLIDGSIELTSSNGPGGSQYFWLPPGGLISEYEIRCVDNTATSPVRTISGSPRNTWLNASTYRPFTWTCDSSGLGALTFAVSATLEIRRVGQVNADVSSSYSNTLVSNGECP